jgi:hypothetical protein
MAWYIYEKLILKFNIFKNIYFKMFKFHLISWFSKRVSTTQNSGSKTSEKVKNGLFW